MTIGQRIAQKRKERSLSQEALGQAVGVSRQSIYKWESDAAVPEIDKLIALSRLFGVSVGWLLGVEEPPEADGADEAASPSAAPEELTEAQLKMVERIVERYTAALPKPQKSPWGKWDVRFLFAACGIILAIVFGISSKVNQLGAQYDSLQNNLAQVQSNVDRQIGSVSSRVEEILQAQNSLVADYEARVDTTDLAQNQVTFFVRVVPKTYTEGMAVEFTADPGGGAAVRAAGSRDESGAFSASLPCPLTDDITVSAVLVNPDGTRSTQLLDHFDSMYSASLPGAQVYGGEQLLWQKPDADGRFTLPELTLWVQTDNLGTGAPDYIGQSEIGNVALGLFLNRCLLTWLEPCDPPEGETDRGARYFRLGEGTAFTMAEETDELVFAAVVTDQYGRRAVYSDIPFVLSGGELGWVSVSDTSDHSPANWTF